MSNKKIDNMFDLYNFLEERNKLYCKMWKDAGPTPAELDAQYADGSWKLEKKLEDEPHKLTVNDEVQMPPPVLPVKKIKKERQSRRKPTNTVVHEQLEQSENKENNVRRSSRINRSVVILQSKVSEIIINDSSEESEAEVNDNFADVACNETYNKVTQPVDNCVEVEALCCPSAAAKNDKSESSFYEDAQMMPNSTFVVEANDEVEQQQKQQPVNKPCSKVADTITAFENLNAKSKIPIVNSASKKSVSKVSKLEAQVKMTSKLKPSTPSTSKTGLRTSEKSAYKVKDVEEALRKKQALLEARKERHRLQNEEKQKRAQKIREEQEKKKLESLRTAEKERVIKDQKRFAERNLLMEKRKLEMEQRRKAVAIKKSKEGIKGHEQKMENGTPLYLLYKEPCLDTTDYRRSADLDANCKEDADIFKNKAGIFDVVPSQLVNTLFSVKPCTPNLLEIFPSIQESKLCRNSSAVWANSPNYSTFTPLDVLTDDSDE